jgi:hypothetical protein
MAMNFVHESAIWAAFPTLVPGVLLVEGIRPDSMVVWRIWTRDGMVLRWRGRAQSSQV